MRAAQIVEVVAGAVCGVAIAGWGMAVAYGLAYLFIDPFQGPFLGRM